jgi:MGT family glycosyltransferase
MIKLTILFAMHFEAGHIMSSFDLAKKLRARGHVISYLCIPDFKALIESQGFNTILFAEDIMPLGYNNVSFSSYWSKRRHRESIFSRYMMKITDGTLDKCISSANADVILCDPFLSYVAIRSLSLGVPTMHLFTSLFMYENQYIPPIVSSLSPGSSLITKMAWKIMFFKFLFVKRLKNLVTGEFKSPTKMHHLVGAYLEICKKTGYPCEKDKTYRLNEIGFNLILPSIMLCTRAFQFPEIISEQRLYLGNFVDFERNEIPLKLNFDNRPVIYCSLGTAASTYPYADRFYQAVMKASSLRKDWQFVLQISDPDKMRRYKSAQNIFVLDWVPQIDMLKQVAVTVTHGGLNSIMECVGFEVPMVIVPGLRDQPGNASRAVYNNIALVTNMKRIEPNTLIELIERAMKSKEIKEGLKRMKSMINEENGLAECISYIESFAESRVGR